MRVTIIADASYCPNTKAGGWGIWVASERGKHGDGGAFEKQVDGSCAAEMMAVVNGLHRATKYNLAQKGDHILLQTDCQSAIDAFSGKRNIYNKDEAKAKKMLYAIKLKIGLTLSFRHVKGHSKSKEARYVTNNLCDERAKKGMRLARSKFKDTSNEK